MKSEKIKLPNSKVAESFEISLQIISEHYYTIEKLAKDLKHFEQILDRRLESQSKIADESKVRKMIAIARRILNICRKKGDAEYVVHCLAAVDYFVNSEDAVHDFEDFDGFDDDHAVFEAVIAKFGLSIDVSEDAT